MMKGDQPDTQERRMARDVNVGPAAEKKLERYGVWVKVEPRSVTRDPAGSFGLTDLESQEPGAPADLAPALSDEEETLLDELETGVGHEVAAGTRDELESLDEQLAAAPADEELPELELEDAVDVPLADDAPGAGRFDDLETLTDDTPPPRTDEAGRPEALSRIELELRSIRSDLAALKQELAALRRPAAATTAAAADAKPAFFEEEEDDTIALTGDELDNILNTADITEESVEAPAAEVDLADVADLAGSAPDVDILPYEGPAAATAPASRPAPRDAVSVEEPIEELEEVADLDLELPADAPSELVLEDAGSTTVVDDLPSLDLEPIPEIETIGEADLEELPADEDASADVDLVADLEEAPEAADETTSFDEIDLKALEATQDGGHETILSTDDLAAADLAELEAVAEEVIPVAEAGIEIDFEPTAAPAATGEQPLEVEDVESLEAVEDLEEIEEIEEIQSVEAIEEPAAVAEAPAQPERPSRQPAAAPAAPSIAMNEGLKNDLRNVLGVIDELLDALPEKKIREFAKSEHFAVYKKLFDDLGLSKPE
jgi:hypothetical protein